jgi:7-cyano-7-deazaguanine synthase
MKHTPSQTIVPFRNGVMISVAVAHANANGYNRVSLAPHMNDATGYAYYDCMPAFLRPMGEAVAHGTHGAVELDFPYTRNTKADIVVMAAIIRAPLQLSWSCYRGGASHCGECPTCLERQKAFIEAGYEDPTIYLKSPLEPEGLAAFPDAETYNG